MKRINKNTPFGVLLVKKLDENNITYNQFADMVGVSPITAYSWSKKNIPTPFYFSRIVYALMLTEEEYEKWCDAIGKTVEQRYKGCVGYGK